MMPIETSRVEDSRPGPASAGRFDWLREKASRRSALAEVHAAIKKGWDLDDAGWADLGSVLRELQTPASCRPASRRGSTGSCWRWIWRTGRHRTVPVAGPPGHPGRLRRDRIPGPGVEEPAEMTDVPRRYDHDISGTGRQDRLCGQDAIAVKGIRRSGWNPDNPR